MIEKEALFINGSSCTRGSVVIKETRAGDRSVDRNETMRLSS